MRRGDEDLGFRSLNFDALMGQPGGNPKRAAGNGKQLRRKERSRRDDNGPALIGHFLHAKTFL